MFTTEHDKAFVKMQGSSGEGSNMQLGDHDPQAIFALLAGVAWNEVPMDLVAKDGHEYTLYRFRELNLLKYGNLSAREVGATALVSLHVPTSLPC